MVFIGLITVYFAEINIRTAIAAKGFTFCSVTEPAVTKKN